MKDFFRDGWDFGLFTLVIGLPIAGALLYIFGVSLWELATDPKKYWLFWLYTAAIFGPSLVKWLRKKSSKATAEEQLDANG